MAKNWVNQNLAWDLILYGLGADVQPGAAITYDFGPNPRTEDAGGQPTYGWRWSHKFLCRWPYVSPTGTAIPPVPGTTDEIQKNVRAILANSCARRFAYTQPDSWYRYTFDDYGMRPFKASPDNWTPEIPPNLPNGVNGDTWPMTIGGFPNFPTDFPPGGTKRADLRVWTGPDMQHNWDVLWEVIRKAPQYVIPFGIPGPTTTLPSGVLSGWRLWMLAEAVAGQMRIPYELNWNDKLQLMKGSDRGWALPLRVNLYAAISGVTNTISLQAGGSDIDSATIAYLDACLEYYLHKPGIATYNLNFGASDVPPVPYQSPGVPIPYMLGPQIAQIVVVLYEWRTALAAIDPAGIQHGARMAKMDTILVRLCKWCIDITYGCTTAPYAGKQPWRVSFTPGALGPLQGIDPTGVSGVGGPGPINPSLAALGAVYHAAPDEFNTDCWMFRACRIAEAVAVVIGDGAMQAAAHNKWDLILNTISSLSPNPTNILNKNDTRQWQWLVGADGLYADGLINGGVTPQSIVGEAASTL